MNRRGTLKYHLKQMRMAASEAAKQEIEAAAARRTAEVRIADIEAELKQLRNTIFPDTIVRYQGQNNSRYLVLNLRHYNGETLGEDSVIIAKLDTGSLYRVDRASERLQETE